MKVREYMTHDVISVRTDTPVHDIASLMVEKRISGVPVLDEENRLVGIVGQGDLLHRAEVGTERRHKWWLRVFGDPNKLAREFSKAHGLKAHDVMSKDVISVGPDAELREVADRLDRYKLKRLPVIAKEQLIGIITRGDLVRALAQAKVAKSGRMLDDNAVYETLHVRMQGLSWLNSNLINVSVDHGVVQFSGFVRSTDQRTALRVLAEEAEGVVRVDDQLKVGIPSYSGI